MTRSTKILVVDDSALYRQSIQNVMREIADVSVVGTAKNGIDAIAKIQKLDPDLLTLDVRMPDMDGIEVLKEIRARGLRPRAIMVSGYTDVGTQATTDALMEGAFDFILKPSSGDPSQNRQQLRDALTDKINAFRQSGPLGEVTGTNGEETHSVDRNQRARRPASKESIPSPRSVCRAVVIGCSTGGPAALKAVLPRFPLSTPAPIFVVQHMPERYTLSLSRRLNDLCACHVKEASDGMVARPGDIVLAAGGRQLKLSVRDDQLVTRVTNDPPENGVRPSIDYALRSTVRAIGGDALAVILTGMGRDGLVGCRDLKEAGGYVFAQSPKDCVVFGMPKVIAEHGLADRTLELGKVAPAVLRHLKRSQESSSA